MAEEVNDLAGHLLTEIHRIHDSHDKIFDKLSQQGETLVRNTISLEEHIRRTNLLEKKMEHVEVEVNGLKNHVDRVNFIMGILKPTKEKIKWLIILGSILGGTYGGYQITDGTTLQKAQEVIQKIIE